MGGREDIRAISTSSTYVEPAVDVTPFPNFQGGKQGSVMYRARNEWRVLPPGTSGQALTTKGASADPEWAAVMQVNFFLRRIRIANAPAVDLPTYTLVIA